MCRVSEDVYDDSPPRERGIIIDIIMATRLVMSVGRVTGDLFLSIIALYQLVFRQKEAILRQFGARN